jgi:hypothetical protein
MKDKYCSLVRAVLPALFITAALVLNTTAIAQAPPGSLWYNGDFNGVGFHANGVNTSDPDSAVYGEFFVTGGGWNLSAVFSDNLLSTVVTGAEFEIRVGISEGNLGTLVASGFTPTPVVAATGRSGFGLPEFMVEITAINVHLAPGAYWLNVKPIGNGTGRSLNTTTSGANCVGMPCGNGESYLLPEGHITSTNFSMGVIGTVVPEPPLWTMMALGTVVLIGVQRFHRSRKKA